MRHAAWMRTPMVFALLMLAAPTAFMQSRMPVFRADASAVVLQVTVTAPLGRDTDDLAASDFTVLEDGAPQDLTLVSHAEPPLALSLMLDTSGSMDDSIGLVQKAAIEFTHRLRTDDLGEVVAFNNQVHVLQPFTPRVAELEQAIRQTSASGTTALYTALYVALRDFDAVPGCGDLRRHAIVLLTDGEDTSSLVGLDEVLDLVKRSNVSIYAIRLGDPPLPGLKKAPLPGADVLEQFAAATGGRAIFINRVKDLAPVYGQIADELASQYTLAYTPPAGHRDDGKWHDVSVKVGRERYTARTRSGYQAEPAGR